MFDKQLSHLLTCSFSPRNSKNRHITNTTSLDVSALAQWERQKRHIVLPDYHRNQVPTMAKLSLDQVVVVLKKNSPDLHSTLYSLVPQALTDDVQSGFPLEEVSKDGYIARCSRRL